MWDWQNRFPSDSVKYALDLKDEIPDEMVASRGQYEQRVSLAVNTHYPEIRGGHYVNWRIVECINRAVDESDLHVVDQEYLWEGGSGPFPTEHLLGVELWAPYVICNYAGVPVGRVMKWMFSVGGGGPFFSDDLIVDFWLDESNGQRVIASLIEVCSRCDITVSHWAPGAGAK